MKSAFEILEKVLDVHGLNIFGLFHVCQVVDSVSVEKQDVNDCDVDNFVDFFIFFCVHFDPLTYTLFDGKIFL